ncbi:Retrovirus-related Pol polyprotein from transposon TNT 1-94 [Vitis vinifera]|uniref:Retrovirus-related Pol polyprotein from transposon TNT 1-94 n=1 Tax=Vitis vinifera TaxID=29760 RepID=A0A438GN92_VITVI|nr:Retrovirus-related Pol polyprotein from transposon TNT 1-94 [Vitis vinifera]
MYITMDVVFHEDSMYFSSESELQEEYHKEIQTLDYDYHISEEDESRQSELVNQEVECPPGKKPVGCRWIYTMKYKADAKINHSSSILSLAANLDWPLQQFDVKNVFLHGELSEEVYMHLPLGCMVSEKQCQKVCKLKKSLYGLKQSPRAWVWKETGMSGCQPVNTPIEEGLKLCVELNQVSTDKGRYQRLVGRLMYLAHTRPDLAYALSVVDDRRSTSGYFTFVGGNLVTWKSKKQNVVAHSSAEAEFKGNQSDCFVTIKPRVTLLINPVQHDRTKHVEVDRFFIKEKLDDKIVELPKIRSEDQLADILTKAVSSQVFSKF